MIEQRVLALAGMAQALKQVRRIFGDFLNAPEDEDFVCTHTPAPTEAVKKYLSGEGAGPDRNYLQFSDLPPYNNSWNRAVASELARILSLRQKGEKWRLSDGRRVSAASAAYWEDAVLEKFNRVRPGWLKTMCQDIVDPSSHTVRRESRAEADARRFEQGEEQHKVARQKERRSKVRILHRCDQYHTLIGGL